MKAVITNSRELAQTQEFLRKSAQDYGADLLTVTNRYIKFRAATQQAGLTAKETQRIFGTMTKAAGVLGLKKDELQGIFLALEQMVSKGKITTEELRRQLGERLPGAMDIMANSMGVTTAQLDEMLKKGEVITKDVLPGFAKQVEIAFGLKNIDRVQTLQAACERRPGPVRFARPAKTPMSPPPRPTPASLSPCEQKPGFSFRTSINLYLIKNARKINGTRTMAATNCSRRDFSR